MYCRNCGREVLENASVCLGCGCWVDRKDIKSTVRKRSLENTCEMVREASAEMALWVKFCLLISFALVCLSIGGIFLSIAMAWVYESSYYCAFYLNDGWLIFSFVASACGLGLAITCFIFGLKAERSFKWMSIANFIFTVVLFLTIFICWGTTW